MYDGWAQEDLGLARWPLKTTRYQAFLVSPASDLIGELRHIGVCRNGISPSRLLTGYSFQQYNLLYQLDLRRCGSTPLNFALDTREVLT